MRLLHIIFGIGIICFQSCSSNRSESAEHQYSDTLLFKEIHFPNYLKELRDGQLYDIEEILYNLEDKRKIVSIIDANCMKCVTNQLNFLDSIFESIIIADDAMIFILNIKPIDSAYFVNNLLPAVDASGLLFWDNDYVFERKNKLFTSDVNLRTFLLDSSNTIVLYGNPIIYPEVIYEYQMKLQQQ